MKSNEDLDNNHSDLNKSTDERIFFNNQLNINESIDKNLNESIHEIMVIDNNSESSDCKLESNDECVIVRDLLINISKKIENGENINFKNDQEKKKRRIYREHSLEQKKIKKEERQKILEEKRKLKDEKKKLWEIKRKEKEQEIEDKKKQNEIKRKMKDAEKERKKRDLEEKKRLEDEKRKLEDEKLNKQQQISNKFLKFFQKVSPFKKLTIGNFQLQKDQTVASYVPKISKDNFLSSIFDSNISSQTVENLYLYEIKNNKRKPYKHLKIKKCNNEHNDSNIIITNNIEKKFHKIKLLQFYENNRPAYFGTWSKKSSIVSGRKPFAQDKNYLDYSIDSDEEWIVDDGESLKDSDLESIENDNENELNDFIVPDGQISDDEKIGFEHKFKININEKSFKEDKTKKTQQLIPKAIGCFWMEEDDLINNEKFTQWEKNKVVFIN